MGYEFLFDTDLEDEVDAAYAAYKVILKDMEVARDIFLTAIATKVATKVDTEEYIAAEKAVKHAKADLDVLENDAESGWNVFDSLCMSLSYQVVKNIL